MASHRGRPVLILAIYVISSLHLARGQASSCAAGCPNSNQPVCANGKRFNNDCHARCAGYVAITPAQNDKCNQSPPAAATSNGRVVQGNPVQGTTTAANTGSLSGSKPPCTCPRDFKPVCGVDGAYFANPCLAKCIGTKVSDQKPKDGKCGYIVGHKPRWQGSGEDNNSNNKVQNNGNKGPLAPSRPQQVAVAPSPGAVPTTAGSRPCNCPDDEQFVCGKIQGVNQVITYQNACTAKCLGAQVISQGFCRSAGGQLQGSSPTQSPNVQGIEPSQEQQQQVDEPQEPTGPENQGFSEPQIALPSSAAPVIQGCNCPRVYEPVCSISGETFGSACVAYCANVQVAYEGECQGSVSNGVTESVPVTSSVVNVPLRCLRPCPRLYLPVCAFGVTYPNLCTARCSGIPRYPLPRLGACR